MDLFQSASVKGRCFLGVTSIRECPTRVHGTSCVAANVSTPIMSSFAPPATSLMTRALPHKPCAIL